MNVAICGGGTGGHLHPLLALAEELAAHDGVRTTLFMSRKTPLSALPAGAKTVSLEVTGFNRGFDSGNLKSLREMGGAILLCRREMKAWGPQVAVAFGGYACVPGAAAALSLGVPLILHEQNVIPGMANRMLAPGAAKIAVSFEDTLQGRPRWRKKAVLTGNPLRREARPGDGVSPWEHFKLEEARKTLAVFGGSQGAASLNRAVIEAIPIWRDRDDLQVVHSVGSDKYQEFMKHAAKVDSGELIYRPLDFVERMDLLYRAADVVVCRAGASTVSELAAQGCAAVLVPYPYATAAHQDANAAFLQRAGAAIVIDDSELDGRRLGREIDGLLDDAQKLAAMREASRRVGKPYAARKLAGLVMATAEEV